MIKTIMSDIYLIRHGETEWNAEGRFQGQLESALTGTGVLQAKAIAHRLAKLIIQADSFFSSPLGRTRPQWRKKRRSPGEAPTPPKISARDGPRRPCPLAPRRARLRFENRGPR